ncbi:MAG TPA: hypothetical protein PK854_00425 [Oscillospiraceae bacterium]|nr:hypothetical protein [Oscillospiraceae bacterium]HPS33717.1 hypothetical protein [Oscillospiraceae bacterium]
MVIVLTVDGALGTELIDVVTPLAFEEDAEALLLDFLEEVLLLALELSGADEGIELETAELGKDNSEAGAIIRRDPDSLSDSLLMPVGAKTGCPLPVSEVRAIEPPVISTAPNTIKMIFKPALIIYVPPKCSVGKLFTD